MMASRVKDLVMEERNRLRAESLTPFDSIAVLMAAGSQSTQGGALMSDADDNKRNLQWFEAASMRALFTQIDEWQATHRKRFASLNVQRDGDLFCCIGVTNPTEVIIMDGVRQGGVDVSGGALRVTSA